jgi:hypothetical protein
MAAAAEPAPQEIVPAHRLAELIDHVAPIVGWNGSLSVPLLLLFAAACAQDADSGLTIEAVDANFGFAKVASTPDAGSGAASSTGSLPVASDAGTDQDASASQGTAPTMTQAVTPEAGPPARTCHNVAGFTQHAIPPIIERCVRCHDGTKSKATKALDLTSARDMSPAGQQAACDQALISALDTSEQSPIFAEVNPSDPKTVHDFKYPSATLYMAYREAILAWLQGEQL